MLKKICFAKGNRGLVNKKPPLCFNILGPIDLKTNGKVEVFWKIIKNEFFYPNSFDSVKDLIYNLGNFLFEYNHLRRHGGLKYMTPYKKLEKVTELLS